MDQVNCPYCGATNDIDCEDFTMNEDVRFEKECIECDKTFVFTVSWSFYFESSKAPCLNGKDHELELSATYPKAFSRMMCKHCDYERPLTNPEKQRFNIPQKIE